MANPSDSDGTASPPHTVHREAASESCGFGGKWDESLILITVIIINIILLQMAWFRLLPVNCWSVEGSEMQWLSSHPSQTSLSCRCVCHPVNCWREKRGVTQIQRRWCCKAHNKERGRDGWLIVNEIDNAPKKTKFVWNCFHCLQSGVWTWSVIIAGEKGISECDSNLQCPPY